MPPPLGLSNFLQVPATCSPSPTTNPQNPCCRAGQQSKTRINWILKKKTTCIVLLTNHIKRSSQVRKIDLTLNCIQYMGNICGKTNFRYATLIFVMSFNRRLLEGSFVDWRMDFMWGDWVGTPRVCLNQQGTTSSNSKSPYNQSKSRLLKELIKITFMLLV